ncbi:MAG: hypothetical protein ACK4TP_11850 [Hyphomicrobium sp.]|jgi:hypothetical protein
MTLLKWVLVIGGVLFLAVGAAIIGIVYWAESIPSVAVTEADLAVGGSYPPEERQALLDACGKRNVSKREDSCTCIADRAGTDLSRFQRLVLIGSLEGSASKIVAVTKGLMESGVAEEKVDALEKDSEQRFEALMQACGLNR